MPVRKLVLTCVAVCALGLAWMFTAPGETVLLGSPHDLGERDDDRGGAQGGRVDPLDKQLKKVLADNGFTGTIGSRVEQRLGRRINDKRAELGRLLFFDRLHSLHHDNTCAGCHSPSNGFGDTQPIAIGVDRNTKVGPHLTGPRNQRRSPLVVNTAFYPDLMWNGRFSTVTPLGLGPVGDPFSNTNGFHFPLPEGDALAPPNDPIIKHLLQAHGQMPPTELVEVAGFTGTCPTLGPDLCVFDNGIGEAVPPPDGSGSRNFPVRNKSEALLNSNAKYRKLFADAFPGEPNGPNGPIVFSMFGRAIAEFEFTLIAANAPIDQFARGDGGAMTASEKRGALVFFDQSKGKCATCHAVKGTSNEMFSDFLTHVTGVPQIAPFFGAGKSNMVYDGPGADEDFGLEQVSGDFNDRYKFRTAPLRNLAVAPGFFHNGAFKNLEDAIRFHTDPIANTPGYSAVAAGVPADLTHRQGPSAPVLARLDPILVPGIHLTNAEFEDLVAFVKSGLFDPGAGTKNLCTLVPKTVPSGIPVLEFEDCHR